MRIPSPTLDRVAAEIGRSSYWWGNIEHALQRLCINLARFIDEDLESAAVWDVLGSILSHTDARQRVAVAKVLAAQGIDPDLYRQIERLLNVIDNDLRNERNRFVHDQWHVEDDVIVRRKHGAHVTRPQSRSLAVIPSADRRYADIEEVAAFTVRVAATLDDLLKLENELTELHAEIWSRN